MLSIIVKCGEHFVKLEKCFNCGRIDRSLDKCIMKGSMSKRGFKEYHEFFTKRIMGILKIETHLQTYSRGDERFVPLCQKCTKLWLNGSLRDIEKRWMRETNRTRFFNVDISQFLIDMERYAVDWLTNLGFEVEVERDLKAKYKRLEMLQPWFKVTISGEGPTGALVDLAEDIAERLDELGIRTKPRCQPWSERPWLVIRALTH